MRSFSIPCIILSSAIFFTGCQTNQTVDETAIRIARTDKDAIPKAAVMLAEARAMDAETANRLSLEGEAYYSLDRNKVSGESYCLTSFLLSGKGEFRQAIRAASKALYLGQRDNDAWLLGMGYRDLGVAYLFAGDLKLAERYAGNALEESGRIASRRRPGIRRLAHKVIGDVALRRGDYEAAIASFERSGKNLSKYRTGRNKRGLGALLNASYGYAYLGMGDTKNARTHFQKALKRTIGARKAVVLRGLAETAVLENSPEIALDYYNQALAAVDGNDQEFERYWLNIGKARLAAKSGDSQAALSSYLTAIRLAESIRDQFRSEEFRTGAFTNLQDGFDEAIVVAAAANDGQAALEISERSRARAMVDLVKGRVETSFEDAALSNIAALDFSLDKLRAALPADTVFVSFHNSSGKTFYWVIGQGRFDWGELGTWHAELAEKSVGLRNGLARGDALVLPIAQDLYRNLIEPLNLPSSTGLIIAAHGELHDLPFQALRDSEGRYLIETHPISYAPSIGVYLALHSRRDTGQTSVVAVGNPDLGDASSDLPAAQKEVEMIGGLYDGSTVLIRKQANKENTLSGAVDAGILHIAAHAEVDRIDPLYSSILLAPSENSNGQLEAHEFYRAGFKSGNLVALSGCETGNAKVGRGEEQWGFSRTLLAAGANRLLLSLWPVADEPTGYLMEAFYSARIAGASEVEAFRTAQVETMKKFPEPVFWAGFKLIGLPQEGTKIGEKDLAALVE